MLDLSEMHCKRSAIALIDNKIPWDMHRPLTESCTIQLLNFTVADPHLANKAFWRTCSFMLGAILKNVVKDEAQLQLHSFPSPNIKTGSFVHDISINQQQWQPNKEELRALSAEMIKLAAKNLRIERLEVHHDLALEMFQYDAYKREQLPSISRSGKNLNRHTLANLFLLQKNVRTYVLSNKFFFIKVLWYCIVLVIMWI